MGAYSLSIQVEHIGGINECIQSENKKRCIQSEQKQMHTVGV